MSSAERDWVRARVKAAGGAPADLAAAFDKAVARFGHERASELWWAVFGAQDAAET